MLQIDGSRLKLKSLKEKIEKVQKILLQFEFDDVPPDVANFLKEFQKKGVRIWLFNFFQISFWSQIADWFKKKILYLGGITTEDQTNLAFKVIFESILSEIDGASINPRDPFSEEKKELEKTFAELRVRKRNRSEAKRASMITGLVKR